VALFAEASSRWVIADGGILMSGAADAVRGSKAGGRCTAVQSSWTHTYERS
jgi:long-subunit acyl-CoA synthetase (AMP-forming)